MVSEKLTSLMDEFISICKERGFHKETASALGIIAGSKNAKEVFGDTTKSFEALVELAKTCKDEQELTNTFCKMAVFN
ncbi:MAG: hypothetical protein IKL79_01260 [Clostridia bacterium]|nr:hypothetical protein [Clostridia bacterium]